MASTMARSSRLFKRNKGNATYCPREPRNDYTLDAWLVSP
jgi:hypothetical protein